MARSNRAMTAGARIAIRSIVGRPVLEPAATAGAHIAKLGRLWQGRADRLSGALVLGLREAEGQRSRGTPPGRTPASNRNELRSPAVWLLPGCARIGRRVSFRRAPVGGLPTGTRSTPDDSRWIRPGEPIPPAQCSPSGFSCSGWRRRPAGKGLKARMSPAGPQWGSFDSGRRGVGLKRTRHDALGKCQRRHGDDHRQADDGQPEPEIERRLFRVVHLKGTPEPPSRFPISRRSLRGQAFSRAFNRLERHRRANPSRSFGLSRHGRRRPHA